jgi:hypothetical protein
MFLYWSIHLAIVRQRQQDPAVGEPSATTTAVSPHGAKA